MDRSTLLRIGTLRRDYDDDKETQRSYCVFCTECLDDSQLQVVQVIPHAWNERYGLNVSDALLVVIAASYECMLNAVVACTSCHHFFDQGCFWAEPASSPAGAAPALAIAGEDLLPWRTVQVPALRLRVDAATRGGMPLTRLQGRQLRLPGAETAHLFPAAPVWEWRRRWAVCRVADLQAKDLGQVGVPGPCDTGASCSKVRDKDCIRRLCKKCCLASRKAQACTASGHQRASSVTQSST